MGGRAVAALSEGGRELVFALCHEIGNVIAAIRLEAHLLDPEEGPVSVARASNAIEDLSARSGALLTQLRALLDASPATALVGVDPSALLAQLREDLLGVGLPRVRARVAPCEPLPRMVGDPERIQSLLLLLALGALDAAADGSELHVAGEAHGAPADGAARAQIRIELAWDAPSGEALEDWRAAPRRGLPLVLQVAESLLEPLGGSVAYERAGRRDRLSLVLPTAPSGSEADGASRTGAAG